MQVRRLVWMQENGFFGCKERYMYKIHGDEHPKTIADYISERCRTFDATRLILRATDFEELLDVLVMHQRLTKLSSLQLPVMNVKHSICPMPRQQLSATNPKISSSWPKDVFIPQT